MKKVRGLNDLVKFRFKGQIYTMPKINLERPDMKNFVKEINIIGPAISKPKTIIRKPTKTKRIIVVRKRPKRLRKRRIIPIHKQKPRKLTGIERMNLIKLADKYGVNRDVVDFEALIDESLTYDENRRILKKKVKVLSRKSNMDYEPERINADQIAHLEELSFRASAGDRGALREFDYYKKLWGL